MIGAEKTMGRAGHNHWRKRMVEIQAAPNRLQTEAPRQRRHAVTGRRRQAALDQVLSKILLTALSPVLTHCVINKKRNPPSEKGDSKNHRKNVIERRGFRLRFGFLFFDGFDERVRTGRGITVACLIVEFIGAIRFSVAVKVCVLVGRITMVVMVSAGTSVIMASVGVRATGMRENRKEHKQLKNG